MSLNVTRIRGALGATVEGLEVDDRDSRADELRAAWRQHQVLGSPTPAWLPTSSCPLARVFGEPEPHGVDGDDARPPSDADDQKPITIVEP